MPNSNFVHAPHPQFHNTLRLTISFFLITIPIPFSSPYFTLRNIFFFSLGKAEFGLPLKFADSAYDHIFSKLFATKTKIGVLIFLNLHSTAHEPYTIKDLKMLKVIVAY